MTLSTFSVWDDVRTIKGRNGRIKGRNGRIREVLEVSIMILEDH